MEKATVTWFNSPKGYIAQIYSQGLEFAFCSADNKQCAPFIYCKDFLHDCVYGQIYNTQAAVYGFSFNPKTNPQLTLEKTRILLTNSSDVTFKEKVENAVNFINQIEKKLHLKRTVASECNSPPAPYDKSGIYLFEGSSRWQEAPPMLSLYSLLLRCGFVHKKEDSFEQTIQKLKNGTTAPYQSRDVSYLTEAEKGIDLILKLGYRKVFYKDMKKNYPQSVDILTFHNQFGIVGFSKESTKTKVPYWHRKSLAKKLAEVK